MERDAHIQSLSSHIFQGPQ